MKRALLAALPAVLALGLVACGDDDDSPSTVGTPPRRPLVPPPTTRSRDEGGEVTLPGGVTIPENIGSLLPGGTLPDLSGISIPDNLDPRPRVAADERQGDPALGVPEPQRRSGRLPGRRARRRSRPVAHHRPDGPVRDRAGRPHPRLMARFDAVWLDAGGVLVLPDPEVLGAAAGVLRRHDRHRPPSPRPLRGDGGEVGPGRRGARLARVRPGLRAVGRRRVRRRRGGGHRARAAPAPRCCGAGRSPRASRRSPRWTPPACRSAWCPTRRADRGRAATVRRVPGRSRRRHGGALRHRQPRRRRGQAGPGDLRPRRGALPRHRP